ncbi:MAG: hypothetical protein E6276_10040, partial [Clostridiales bacterium]|nr:hypothetical protein [Clostridiales bacterium]
KLIVRRVEVGEKEVKIYFNFPPNSCTPRAHAPGCTLGVHLANLLSISVAVDSLTTNEKSF